MAVAKCVDTSLVLRSVFPVVGQIEQSQRWPRSKNNCYPVPLTDALRRAWEFRGKIFRRRAAVPVNDNVSNLRSNWQPTLEDVKEGYMVGSFRVKMKSLSSSGLRNGSLHRELKLSKRTKFPDVAVDYLQLDQQDCQAHAEASAPFCGRERCNPQ